MTDIDALVERANASLFHLEVFCEGDDLKRVRDAISALRTLKAENERLREALEEAAYAVRNATGKSEWSRRHASRPFDYEDFCVWAEHWCLMHPVVAEIAARDDEKVRASLGDGQ